MKKLSTLKFQKECKTLELRGKCAVLLDGTVRIDKFIADKETTKREFNSSNFLKDKNIDRVLINFKVSPNFLFHNFEKIMIQLLRYTEDDLDVVVSVTYDENSNQNIANITIFSMNKKAFYINVIEKIFMSLKKCLTR